MIGAGHWRPLGGTSGGTVRQPGAISNFALAPSNLTAVSSFGTATAGQTDPYGGTGAYLFNGTSSRFTYSSRISLGSVASYEVWFKTTSTSTANGYAGNPAHVIFGDHTNSVGCQVGVHGGKFQYRRYNGSGWSTATHTATVSDGAWHHGAVHYSNATGVATLWVDGVAEMTSITYSSVGNGGVSRLGSGYLNGSADDDFFDGSLFLPVLYPNAAWSPFP